MATVVRSRPVRRRAESATPALQVTPSSMIAADDLARWQGQPIVYVDHPLFHRPNADGKLARLRPETLDRPAEAHRAVSSRTALLPSLAQHELLTADEERYLFALMNHLKFKAEKLRLRLTTRTATAAAVQKMEALLHQANETRNLIVQRNLRLLVALAKKLAGRPQYLSELVSEAFAPLIRAVELFDVSLGNRFSTYATWAARNQMLRSLKKMSSNPVAAGEEELIWDRIPDHRSQERPIAAQSPVLQLLEQLTEREQMVVAARFGLNGEASGQSLTEIASRVGLSKERVRQISLVAVERLRQLARHEGLAPGLDTVTLMD